MTGVVDFFSAGPFYGRAAFTLTLNVNTSELNLNYLRDDASACRCGYARVTGNRTAEHKQFVEVVGVLCEVSSTVVVETDGLGNPDVLWAALTQPHHKPEFIVHISGGNEAHFNRKATRAVMNHSNTTKIFTLATNEPLPGWAQPMNEDRIWLRAQAFTPQNLEYVRSIALRGGYNLIA